MAITAEQVKALRDKTGAGMMECKAALTEAGGDIEQAIDILRKRGLAQAAKKAGRSTSEGLIGSYLSADQTIGALVEVNCESDFVARTEDFQSLMRDAAKLVADAGDAASEAWLKDPAGPIGLRVAAGIAKLGENMAVSRSVRFAGEHVGIYIHLGGKIGVLVEFGGLTPGVASNDAFKTLVKEIAMQVAAAQPHNATRAEVSADVLDHERGIYRAQMENSGKPANVIEKIVEGKLGGYFEQFVLVDQPSIRDPKVKVSQVIDTAAKALGAPVRVVRFARLRVGESVA